ncbi:MAG TPA: response regulator [Chryseosolibacter sp.]|nr:response regulator [Chryseosolibacter sp.]
MTPKARLLIVDDDEEDRELFCEAVKQLNSRVECHEAVDGEDALTLLTEKGYRPDYIFLDLNMPRINGVEFLKTLKKVDAVKDTPVIIYTTSKRAEDKEQMKKLGAVHFISKPHSLRELLEAISFVLEKKWERVPKTAG